MKILIIKPSALGDIVQALPVLTGLKRRWPAAQIDWVVNDNLQEILEGHPCLRRTVYYPRKRWTSATRIPEMWRWGRHLRDEKYDMTIDLQGLFRSALMTWAAASPRRLGLTSAREGSRAAYNEFINPGSGTSDTPTPGGAALNNGGFATNMDKRNAYYGPGTWDEDFKLAKNFKIHERYGINISATFINMYNHANSELNLGGANDVSSYPYTLAYKTGNRNTELEARFVF